MSDSLTPFVFENAAVRGAYVSLPATVRQVLACHPYPPAVARVLGELLAACALLASTIKFEGSLIAQLSGDGPVRLLVVAMPIGPLGKNGDGVDATTHNLVRGLAAAGHHVELVAPADSLAPPGCAVMHEADGVPEPSILGCSRAAPPAIVPGGLLGRMWQRAAQLAPAFDAVLNLGYDWLPLALTPTWPGRRWPTGSPRSNRWPCRRRCRWRV